MIESDRIHFRFSEETKRGSPIDLSDTRQYTQIKPHVKFAGNPNTPSEHHTRKWWSRQGGAMRPRT